MDSIPSTHQIEQRMLRSCIADLKQKLETKDIQSYEWLTDENMIADILTKEKRTKDGLEDVLTRNELSVVNRGHNKVIEEDGEFLMENVRTKSKNSNIDDKYEKVHESDLLEDDDNSKQKKEAGE